MGDVTVAAPYALLAELTHRCPLHCAYCSNPIELIRRSGELTTDEWLRVFDEAAALGVVQTHLSGGEPLVRPDLEAIVERASRHGIYTQLVTSGVGLTEQRLAALQTAGLRSIQLSVQAASEVVADRIAGRSSVADKERAAVVIHATALPFGMNVVLHRDNLHEVDAIIDMAVRWGVQRLELANVQFYSWALRNREELLPSPDQLRQAEAAVIARREALRGRLEIVWVISDYHDDRPKPCLGGWGSVSLTVAPDGTVLPCMVSRTISTLSFDTVRERDLRSIWYESSAFNAFRGTEWMQAPCRTCALRDVDFGGCRCQAFMLTGDARAADPVCSLSPHHHVITDVLSTVPSDTPPPLAYRGYGPSASASRPPAGSS
jgi:pyrroloquinoline quinone biosynthesis protein E